LLLTEIEAWSGFYAFSESGFRRPSAARATNRPAEQRHFWHHRFVDTAGAQTQIIVAAMKQNDISQSTERDLRQ
jgi:hypothetical protein